MRFVRFSCGAVAAALWWFAARGWVQGTWPRRGVVQVWIVRAVDLSCVCVCVCVYVCVCIYVYVCIYTYVCVYVCPYGHACTSKFPYDLRVYLYLSVCMYIHIRLYVSKFIHTINMYQMYQAQPTRGSQHMYTYMHACMHACIHTYIPAYTTHSHKDCRYASPYITWHAIMRAHT